MVLVVFPKPITTGLINRSSIKSKTTSCTYNIRARKLSVRLSSSDQYIPGYIGYTHRNAASPCCEIPRPRRLVILQRTRLVEKLVVKGFGTNGLSCNSCASYLSLLLA